MVGAASGAAVRRSAVSVQTGGLRRAVQLPPALHCQAFYSCAKVRACFILCQPFPFQRVRSLVALEAAATQQVARWAPNHNLTILSSGRAYGTPLTSNVRLRNTNAANPNRCASAFGRIGLRASCVSQPFGSAASPGKLGVESLRPFSQPVVGASRRRAAPRSRCKASVARCCTRLRERHQEPIALACAALQRSAVQTSRHLARSAKIRACLRVCGHASLGWRSGTGSAFLNQRAI